MLKGPAMGALKPESPGPWFPYRKATCSKARELGLRAGDVLCRLGNAAMNMSVGTYLATKFIDWLATKGSPLRGPVDLTLQLPFSVLIAEAGRSKYSHAAMVYGESGDEMPAYDAQLIADVDDAGFKLQPLSDWLNAVRSDDILILRHKSGTWETGDKCRSELQKIVAADPAYDGDFDPTTEAIYCVELIYLVYKAIGIDLGSPTPFNKLAGWTPWHNLFARIGGLPVERPIYHVGNEHDGLLASKELVTMATLRLDDFK